MSNPGELPPLTEREASQPKRKKPRRKLTVILVCLLVVALLGGALAALLLLDDGRGGEESSLPSSEPDTSAVLIDKTLANGKEVEKPISRIAVETVLESYVLSPNEDGDLQLESCRDLPRNSALIQSLVEALTVIEVEKTVTEDPAAATEFGFDLPLATVSVTYHDGEELVFSLCSLPLGSEGYYLKVRDKAPIYIASAEFGEQLLQKETAFIGTTLFTAPTPNEDDANGSAVLKEMSLTGSIRDQIITLHLRDSSDSDEYANSSYVLTEPYAADVNGETISTLIAGTSLSAAEAVVAHPTDEQLAEYGLDKPRSIAKIVTAVRTSKTNDAGEVIEESYYNERTNLVVLGKRDKDGNYYALVNALEVVYLLSADSVPWAEATYEDYVNDMLYYRSITNIERFTCVLNGKTHAFDLTHVPDAESQPERLIVKEGDKQYDTEDFRSLYQVLMTIRRTGEAPAEPSGDPVLVVRLEPINKKHRTLETSIYRHSASVYICRTSEGDTYKVSASNVDHALEQLERFLAGEVVLK